MVLRSGWTLWQLRNVILGTLVMFVLLNAWIMTITLQEQKQQQTDPACEEQRDALIETIKTFNKILRRQDNTGEEVSKPLVKARHEDKSIVCEDCNRSGLVDTEATRVLGKPRKTKGFLTIGIPTVKRDQNSQYLGITINSLIEHTTEAEREQVTVVIFLADFDSYHNKKLSLEISHNYSQHLDGGFMQVIQAPISFYPQLEGLKQNFNDSEDRVKWRSKQCVDYAFLFSYCRGLSEFYLQLEDDVVSSEHYLTTIRDYIKAQKSAWSMLEFSDLGFIGKLLRSSDLQRLADFLLLFYEEMPNDFLIRHFLKLLPHRQTFARRPSLFQHIGKRSSLVGKEQNLVDAFYVDTLKRQYNDSDNPPAVVSSDMAAFGEFKPQLAYGPEPGFFWIEAPQSGQAFFVLFEKPARLSRIVIETSSEQHPKDILEKGTVQVSPKLLSMSEQDNTPNCADYVKLGYFENGRFEMATQGMEGLGSVEVKCLKVTVTEQQKMWILVREIAVWTVKKEITKETPAK
ncbi:Alpha-1,3-mannosyl-glycoprotein 4-beta-N-acetylglucosaminyltransferase C [Branchiostoma belcheri]|nr:Alpha-1,3-mannosyl-glycoprotein 4-beta-N-acetylglucosaminyltransferase C [Branchiostoma belcheri]